MSDYEDLKPRLFRYGLDILEVAGALPENKTGWTLEGQIVRSGTSVGANYRESQRSRSRAEFISKLHECLGELEETDYWLKLAEFGGLAPRKLTLPLRQETDELIAIFVTSIRTAEENDS